MLTRISHHPSTAEPPERAPTALRLIRVLNVVCGLRWRARTGARLVFTRSGSPSLRRLKTLCPKMAKSTNEKARQLGVEFLNDWDASSRVLEPPHRPLTNNMAERIPAPRGDSAPDYSRYAH